MGVADQSIGSHTSQQLPQVAAIKNMALDSWVARVVGELQTNGTASTSIENTSECAADHATKNMARDSWVARVVRELQNSKTNKEEH